MSAPQPPAISIPPVPSQTYLHHTSLDPRPKLILIGDSITELGSSHAQGWVTSLSIRYNRRVDVLNRGMNGYNSRWGIAALPLILEEILGPAASAVNDALINDIIDDESRSQKRQRINPVDIEDCPNNDEPATTPEKQKPQYSQYTFIIGYGANDSCLPDGAHSRHHVPLNEYSSNLKRMVQTIQTWNTEKNIAVAILTPPPCDTKIQDKSRDNENVTKLYAEACVKVASEMGVPVVDLWKGMQSPISKDNDEDHISFESKQQWKIDYLSDGLHLTPKGNYRLYELVVEVLDRSADDEKESLGLGLAVSTLARSYPDHSLVDAMDPKKTFSANRA